MRDGWLGKVALPIDEHNNRIPGCDGKDVILGNGWDLDANFGDLFLVINRKKKRTIKVTVCCYYYDYVLFLFNLATYWNW